MNKFYEAQVEYQPIDHNWPKEIVDFIRHFVNDQLSRAHTKMNDDCHAALDLYTQRTGQYFEYPAIIKILIDKWTIDDDMNKVYPMKINGEPIGNLFIEKEGVDIKVAYQELQ